MATLSLSPDAGLSLYLTSVVCPYVKKRITLAKNKKEKNRKGSRITRCTSHFALCFYLLGLILLLDFSLELGSLVVRSGLLFELDKLLAPLTEGLICKPLKASIFSFPGEQVMLL